jgi:hypothetical protein
MIRAIVLVVAFIVGATIPARANMTLESYEDDMKNPQKSSLAEIYISGVVEGFFWANAADQAQNRPPLYCQPGKLILTLDQQLQIFNAYVKSKTFPPDMQVGIITLLAFRDTFPCP